MSQPVKQMPVIKIGKVIIPQKKMNIGQPQLAPVLSHVTVKAPKAFKPVPVVVASIPIPSPPPPPPVVTTAVQPSVKKERKKTEKKEQTLKQKLVAFLKENNEPVSGKSEVGLEIPADDDEDDGDDGDFGGQDFSETYVSEWLSQHHNHVSLLTKSG
jgi:hypothetical protein